MCHVWVSGAPYIPLLQLDQLFTFRKCLATNHGIPHLSKSFGWDCSGKVGLESAFSQRKTQTLAIFQWGHKNWQRRSLLAVETHFQVFFAQRSQLTVHAVWSMMNCFVYQAFLRFHQNTFRFQRGPCSWEWPEDSPTMHQVRSFDNFFIHSISLGPWKPYNFILHQFTP